MSSLAKPSNDTGRKSAQLFRMVTEDHVCPYGLKAKALLERKGYAVQDHHLKNRDETDAFKAKHDVQTTPQTFIGGDRIGGYDDLKAHFGKPVKKAGQLTYTPIIAIFAVAALMALAISWASSGTLISIRAIELFIAVSMCILGVQKLRDLSSFSSQFLGYDLLAQRYVRYAYVYPFAETGAGILMIAGALTWIAAPTALFIGLIGAVSVYKAVYIDKRDLKCACVGGDSNVPLGFVSLTENLMMVAMAVWMGAKAFAL